MENPNDCPNIIAENIRRLRNIYPRSIIFLYDWGHKQCDLDRFKIINANMVIVPWPHANNTNYMYEKVRCIVDCYTKNHNAPLLFLDSDVVVYKNLDRLFIEQWDVGVTWRPEGHEVNGVKQWLNGGVIFFNTLDIKNTQGFLDRWLSYCDKWDDKAWWVDQVELSRLCQETENKDALINAPETIATLKDSHCRIRTFHFSEWNFYPSSSTPYAETNRTQARIIHFKGKWRKDLFRLPKIIHPIVSPFVLTYIGNKNFTIRTLLKISHKLGLIND